MLPNRKVWTGATVGTIVTTIFTIVSSLTQIEFPPEIVGAVTTLATFATSYFVKEPVNG